MIKKRERALYKAAEETFGASLQLTVANEELAELQQQICKVMRGIAGGAHLTEEIADVLIIAEELVVMMDISERDLLRVKTRKQHRLIKTIAAAKGLSEEETVEWIKAVGNI